MSRMGSYDVASYNVIYIYPYAPHIKDCPDRRRIPLILNQPDCLAEHSAS